ncbi:MAG: hypothetical protein IPG99_14685 [Ignavibacteria bacterium]|nr:hypothetical protein [Ignavibacteria bacterium]
MNIYDDLQLMFPQIAAEAGFSLFRMRFLPNSRNSSEMQFLTIEVSPLFLRRLFFVNPHENFFVTNKIEM